MTSEEKARIYRINEAIAKHGDDRIRVTRIVRGLVSAIDLSDHSCGGRGRAEDFQFYWPLPPSAYIAGAVNAHFHATRKQ